MSWGIAHFLRIYVAQDGNCFHCGQKMGKQSARQKSNGKWTNGWTREHVVPRSKGGIDGPNIVLAHMECNWFRGNRMPSPKMLERAQNIYAKAKDIPISRILHL